MNDPLCFCNSGHTFELCCKPYIHNVSCPETPEQLMRSRFSAYATKNFQYILDTYTITQRKNLTLQVLSQGGDDSHWLRLDVLDTFTDNRTQAGEVEFVAYYRQDNVIYQMHERSKFFREEDQWRYDSGVLFEDGGVYKPQRNDSCLCGSGKKFKKCCM